MHPTVHALAAGALAVALAAASGCGSSGPCIGPGCTSEAACPLPAGCRVAIHVAGACTCEAWAAASTVRVKVPYVVASVVYPGMGTGTTVGYGSGLGGVLGSRWRAVVRAPGTADEPVSVTSLDAGDGWPLTEVTPTTLSISLFADEGWLWTSTVDLPSSDEDVIVLWVNPSFLLRTTVTGERQGEWSWGNDCFPYGSGEPCVGAVALPLTVGEIQGTRSLPATWTGPIAFLESLTSAERADILAHDPLLDPAARTVAALDSDPRYVKMGEVAIVPPWGSPQDQLPISWTPCTGAPSDADLPVFAESAFSLPVGGDLVLQHTVDVVAPSCAPEAPTFQLQTTTAGCQIQATVYVDRAFGTLVTVPTASTASCTSG